jgi:hypothetical protein
MKYWILNNLEFWHMKYDTWNWKIFNNWIHLWNLKIENYIALIKDITFEFKFSIIFLKILHLNFWNTYLNFFLCLYVFGCQYFLSCDVVNGWLTHWCVAKKLKGLIFSYVICLKIDTWHIIMIIKKTKWKITKWIWWLFIPNVKGLPKGCLSYLRFAYTN